MKQANDFPQLLKYWSQQSGEHEWVLGTVYKTTGPTYRKAGAFMLFNSLGQQFGLLSGGCLESDIQRHAKAVMASGESLTVCYDSSDEDDISFQFGIGCGGTVYILLQPLCAENGFLQFHQLAACLEQRQQCIYVQKISAVGSEIETACLPESTDKYLQLAEQLAGVKSGLLNLDMGAGPDEYLATVVRPPIHLLVIGGGVDARPLVSIASDLGWEVTLCDSRPANGRREHFLNADNILNCPVQQLPEHPLYPSFNAAVVMSHNLQMDAAALLSLQSAQLSYLALLGPQSRKSTVMELAGLDAADLSVAVVGPAGLNLGGELPESLALSILAQCHAVLHNGDAQPFFQGD